MYDDARLSTLFHEATADVEPDVPELVQGGIARGRVTRRHRKVTMALASVAVAGIAGLAVAIAPGTGTGSGGVDIQPAGSSGSAQRSPTTPATQRSMNGKETPPPPPAVADIPVKAADLPGLFNRLYPGRITPADKRTGGINGDGRQAQIATFRWKGFTTTVGFTAYHGTPAERCREFQQDQPRVPLTCTQRPDGAVLTSSRETGDGGLVSVGVLLFTRHGYEIDLVSYNKADLKSGPVLSAEPPFSVGQLTQAVTSDVWFN